MANDASNTSGRPDPHNMFTALTTIIGRASLLSRHIQAGKTVGEQELLETLRLIEQEGWEAFEAARVILDHFERAHES